MRNLTDPRLQRYAIAHPFGPIPDDMRAYVGCFMIAYEPAREHPTYTVTRAILRVIASRGGDYLGRHDEAARWDHVSVSLADRIPSWSQMCFIKELFFERDEPAMQLHPVREYINNHPYCLHLWRPLDVEIPMPPSSLVGLKEFNP